MYVKLKELYKQISLNFFLVYLNNVNKNRARALFTEQKIVSPHLNQIAFEHAIYLIYPLVI